MVVHPAVIETDSLPGTKELVQMADSVDRNFKLAGPSVGYCIKKSAM